MLILIAKERGGLIGTRLINEYIEHDDFAELRIVGSKHGNFSIALDLEDVERSKEHQWCIMKTGRKSDIFYVLNNKNGNCLLLHRFIMGVTDKNTYIDHMDGNTLNCRKYNLRKCSHAENNINKTKDTYASSGRKGVVDVFKFHPAKRWMVYISLNGKNKTLGYFSDFDEAVKCRENAEEKYYGEFLRK